MCSSELIIGKKEKKARNRTGRADATPWTVVYQYQLVFSIGGNWTFHDRSLQWTTFPRPKTQNEGCPFLLSLAEETPTSQSLRWLECGRVYRNYVGRVWPLINIRSFWFIPLQCAYNRPNVLEKLPTWSMCAKEVTTALSIQMHYNTLWLNKYLDDWKESNRSFCIKVHLSGVLESNYSLLRQCG